MNTALEYSTRVVRGGAVDVKRVLLRFSTPDPSKNTFNEAAISVSAHSAGAYVHCNFTGEGKCNKRGCAWTPHPHQPGPISPSSLNVRQKAAVATLCTLWVSTFHLRVRIISIKTQVTVRQMPEMITIL
jgi:hypothetical protein